MSLPFYPEGKRKLTITDIAMTLNVDELTVVDAIRLNRPGRLKKGLRHRYRELEAYEFRQYIIFRQRIERKRIAFSGRAK